MGSPYLHEVCLHERVVSKGAEEGVQLLAKRSCLDWASRKASNTHSHAVHGHVVVHWGVVVLLDVASDNEVALTVANCVESTRCLNGGVVANDLFVCRSKVRRRYRAQYNQTAIKDTRFHHARSHSRLQYLSEVVNGSLKRAKEASDDVSDGSHAELGGEEVASIC